MLLPMGNLTKARVREIAAERGFLKAAHKPVSYTHLDVYKRQSASFTSYTFTSGSYTGTSFSSVNVMPYSLLATVYNPLRTSSKLK